MASISTQKASSSSSFSSSTPQWNYDVFLSFRGEDTRNNFTDHLYAALKQKGIVTFRDEEKLETGKSISLELFRAIEESRFSIVILSKNYASSTWCLDELVKIIGRMKEMKMTVLPIFYDVDPSDVRKQTNTFAQAFSNHEERFKDCIGKVQTWRIALREVANLKGWHIQDKPESKTIQHVVGELWQKLSYAFSENIEDLVGIISRVEKFESCLALGSNDVRIIGVWGMGGIGKTTLARVVFHMVSDQFESCCFLANVREVSENDGLVPLQKQLIHQILNEHISIQDVDDGVFLIRNRFRHKRILLVLDDINQLDQLNKLAGKHIWFGSGSRVIITTRDKHLLQTLGVDEIYEANGLTNDESLHLFSLKAFKKDHPPKDYLELSKDFVHYANGLPLAIEVLGSFLFDRSVNQWKSALNRLKQFPESNILQVLRISFEGLHETEKEIFLNIACFFNRKKKNNVVEILDYLGLFPDIGLGVLFDKSLVKFDDRTLWMHDLLREMGRNIVYEECPNEPGKRGKLWLFEDINNVLTENTGTEAIQGIVLKLLKPKQGNWNIESFSKIRHLKLLIIDEVYLLHEPKHLPNGLRFLDWSGYPSKSFPSSFQPKSFDRLKFIRLKKSIKLIETLDFTGIPVLEKLVLKDCINLLGVHQSIGVHKKLKVLNLKGCKNLKTLPRKFEMESLKILILSDCSKVKRIPEFGENMKCVSELYLDGTAITKLPTSIGHLMGLASLILKDCKNLMSLPSTFFNIKSQKILNLSGCSKLNFGTAERPMHSSNETLKELALGGFKGLSSTNKPWYELLPFYSMPRNPNPMGLLLTSISNFCSLTKLDLSYCNLNAIPHDIGRLFSLWRLDLNGNNFGCLPESIAQLSNLRIITLEDCTSLRSLPKLPMSIDRIWGFGCTSLETVPNLLKPNSLREPYLYLSNCSKLVNNQGFIDMFFAVIRKHLQGLSLRYTFNIVIPGSEIPEWFSHQSIGSEVNTQEPSHLYYEWMGFACCVVISSHYQDDNNIGPRCRLTLNGKGIGNCGIVCDTKILSDHLWLIYFPSQNYDKYLIKSLSECDANGFVHFGIRIETEYSYIKGKKCGLRMVYKKDIEDLSRIMAQSSNTSIIPYEGLDVTHHNFDNSAVVAKGKKAKQSWDDYIGARPSGEGSSNDPKRIEILPEFMAHGDFDCQESNEYEKCGEERGDWQESSPSDREGCCSFFSSLLTVWLKSWKKGWRFWDFKGN